MKMIQKRVIKRFKNDSPTKRKRGINNNIAGLLNTNLIDKRKSIKMK